MNIRLQLALAFLVTAACGTSHQLADTGSDAGADTIYRDTSNADTTLDGCVTPPSSAGCYSNFMTRGGMRCAGDFSVPACAGICPQPSGEYHESPQPICSNPPPVVGACPVDRASAVGTSCSNESQECGSVCCGSVIRCIAGEWTAVTTTISCLRCDEFTCGTGSCVENQQICVGTRGNPAPGQPSIRYECEARPPNVTTCAEAQAAFTDSCNSATECTGTLADFNVTVNCNCC